MLKILMDFDGVFTDPREEGARCREFFVQGLESLAGFSTADALRWVSQAEREVEAEPLRYGWRNQGRVSAFAVEDPFIRTQGIADWLDDRASAKGGVGATGDSRQLLEARARLVSNGLASFFALSGHAFNQMSKERMERGGAAPDPEAVASVKQWLASDAGTSIVVVSNSDPAKLAGFFAGQGIETSERFRLVGGAGKFELSAAGTGEREVFRIGDVEYPVDRPRYRAVLEAEKPDAVIGDCLSLDLSLPASLFHGRNGAHGAFSRGLYLRRRAYTPMISIDAIQAERARQATPLRVAESWSEIRFEPVATD